MRFGDQTPTLFLSSHLGLVYNCYIISISNGFFSAFNNIIKRKYKIMITINLKPEIEAKIGHI